MYSWVRYITLIPYVVWLMGKREGLWDWFPAFIVETGTNYTLSLKGGGNLTAGLIYCLLMLYYTKD